MILGEEGVLNVAFRLFQALSVLLVEHVANALEEEHREDVRLEVRGIDWTTKDVGGLPEVGFQPFQSDHV